jgi:predicted RNA-binding protein with PIN domain
VFDGKGEHLPHALKSHIDALTIVYTPARQTADEYILQEVETSNHPSDLTVVSNDSELICKSALHQAKTLSLKEFIQSIEKKNIQKRKRLTTSSSQEDSPYHIARLLVIFEQQLKDKN